MKNWEVIKKKINAMTEEDFIIFIKEKLSCDTLRNILGINEDCEKCIYGGRKYCKRVLLESEYQPPKQQKWIVHRTLRKKGIETYVSYLEIDRAYFKNKWNTRIIPDYTYNKNYAKSFNKHQAIKVRDELNKDRVGKQYLWVISRVEE